MGIPILAGRAFGPQDTASSQHVAVISERIARTMFPSGKPHGRHFSISDDGPNSEKDVEVIGVAKDVKFGDLGGEASEDIDYLPYTQHLWSFGDFEVRYTGDFTSISKEVQQVIHSIDHNLPITRVTTLDEQVARYHHQPAARRPALHLLRAARRLPLRHRNVRPHVLRRQPPHQRNRHPHGPGRSTSNVSWLVMREISCW